MMMMMMTDSLTTSRYDCTAARIVFLWVSTYQCRAHETNCRRLPKTAFRHFVFRTVTFSYTVVSYPWHLYPWPYWP